VLHEPLHLGPVGIELLTLQMKGCGRLPVPQPATGRATLPLRFDSQGFGPLPAPLVVHRAAIGATTEIGPVGLVAVRVRPQAGVEPLLAGPVAAAGRIDRMDHGRDGRCSLRLRAPAVAGGGLLRGCRAITR